MEKDNTGAGQALKLLEKTREILATIEIKKENIPQLLALVKQIWLTLEPRDLEIIEVLEKVRDMKDVCKPIGVVSSLYLKQGDIIEVVVKGRYERIIRGKFKCTNTVYGDIVLTTSEGGEISIKIASVKMVVKRT